MVGKSIKPIIRIANSARCRIFISVLVAICFPYTAFAQEAMWPEPSYHRSIDVNGHKIFYREAGDSNKQTIVLLHGYPASSHTYRHLIPLLSSRFHVVAPDNLGSGYSDKPDATTQPYTFDILADTISDFLKAKKIDRYVIYMQDFGAPVGFRVMMKHPEKVAGLITQNGNAYLDGLTQPRRAFFKQAHFDRSPAMIEKLFSFTGIDGVKQNQYLRDVKGREEIMSPDAWTHDLHFLQDHSQRLIQVQLLQDYYNNLLAYPRWQEYLRQYQPPTLIVWGGKDPAFITAGGRAFLRDLPNAKFHVLDAGHFAVEEKPVAIAKHITKFMLNLGVTSRER